MKCPSCHTREAIDHKALGILPCDVCQKADEQYSPKPSPEFYSISKKERIEAQRDKSGKDTLQPFVGKGEPNPEFARAYPELATNYYSPEQLRKL